MDVKAAYDRLKDDQGFKKWQKENKQCVLAHAFITVEGDMASDWQFGFYNKDNDKMVTFFVQDKIQQMPEAEIFKRPEAVIVKFEIEDVKIPFARAMDVLNEFKEKEFDKEHITKSIVILQHIQDIGLVWNVTNLTQTLNVLNVKISADSGEIKKHSFEAIMNFKAK
ncbi:hypothetical protein ACFL1H_01120 [Nanoarchaeota archaeon]